MYFKNLFSLRTLYLKKDSSYIIKFKLPVSIYILSIILHIDVSHTTNNPEELRLARMSMQNCLEAASEARSKAEERKHLVNVVKDAIQKFEEARIGKESGQNEILETQDGQEMGKNQLDVSNSSGKENLTLAGKKKKIFRIVKSREWWFYTSRIKERQKEVTERRKQDDFERRGLKDENPEKSKSFDSI